MLNSTSDSLFTDWPSGVGGSAREDALYPIGAIGISVGSQASVMLVWGLILERIFTL